LAACGNADYRRCKFCHAWDSPENMSCSRSRYWHKSCLALAARIRRAKARIARSESQ
jgi:hypothetical protein